MSLAVRIDMAKKNLNRDEIKPLDSQSIYEIVADFNITAKVVDFFNTASRTIYGCSQDLR